MYSPTSSAWLLSPLVRIHCSFEGAGLQAAERESHLVFRAGVKIKEGKDILVVRLDYTVHDRNGRAGDFVDCDVAVNERGVAGHGEEEEVAALFRERVTK